MNDIEKLAEYFLKFPGIGRRQAKRFVYFLLRKDNYYRKELAKLVNNLGESITQCSSCFRYFPKNGHDKCDVCIDISRDQGKLLIVEKDSDFENMHSAGIYDGLYFILGGLIPISTDRGKESTRLAQLLARIKTDIAEKKLKEIIIALSLNPEGEHTRFILEGEIEKLAGKEIKISTLGRGFSTGTEVEYSDIETLKNALERRG